MWHEARRQEKAIRCMMVDFQRRADRRKEFYEKIRQDPTQFLRCVGQSFKIHVESSVALAAESPQSMMPWQGDKGNMIGRFDVRAHLDFIPEGLACPTEFIEGDAEEERKMNYERYRTLVQNDLSGVTEEQCLQQIYLDEMYGDINKIKTEKAIEDKKRSDVKKAAIGYAYDSEKPDDTQGMEETENPEDNEDNESEDDIPIEHQDLDVLLDPEKLTERQLMDLDACSQNYGMKPGDFINLLEMDRDELEIIREAKALEEAKGQFRGKRARRERKEFKERMFLQRGVDCRRGDSPLAYAVQERSMKHIYSPRRRHSSSRSLSPPGEVTFINSFGGGSSDGETESNLPPNATKRISGTKDRSKMVAGKQTDRCNRKVRSKSPGRSRSRSPSRNASSGRILTSRYSSSRRKDGTSSYSRDPSPRSSSWRFSGRTDSSRRHPSSSDSRRASLRRRSRSRDRSLSRGRYRRRSRSRVRSTSRSRRHTGSRYRDSVDFKRNSSSFRKSRSSSRNNRNNSTHKRRSISGSKKSLSRDSSKSDRRSSKSRSSSKDDRSELIDKRTEVPLPIKRYRRPSLESNLGSSEEDSETNGCEPKTVAVSLGNRTTVGSKEPVKVSGAERLKKLMQLKITKQQKKDQLSRREKRLKETQERIEREEEFERLYNERRRLRHSRSRSWSWSPDRRRSPEYRFSPDGGRRRYSHRKEEYSRR